MPYGRRRSYRRVRGRRPYGRRSTRGTNYVRSISSGIKMARRAWTLATRLRRLVNVEIKKFDANTSATYVDSTGGLYPLCEVPQGDNDQTRDGKSIKPLSLLIRGECINDATAKTTCTRIMLLQDTQQIADTTPSVSDVLDGTLAPVYMAPLNNETVGRFRVLADFRVMLDDAKVNRKPWTIYKKLVGHIRYNGIASTDIQKGGYYLLCVSDQATNRPTITFNSRLSFTDN